MIRTPLFTMPVALVLAAVSAGHARGQAVQLPTFQFFTVQTTVSVPDRGGAYLGGVRRAASGSASRGVPLLSKAPGLGRLGRNEAIGSTVGGSNAAVTATIIDHHELDAAVQAEARERREAPGIANKADGVRGETASGAESARFNRAAFGAAPVASVADMRRQNEAQDVQRRQETLVLIEKGRQAEAAGKANVAKVYYQMAARRADDALRQRIEAHLAALRAAESRLAAARP